MTHNFMTDELLFSFFYTEQEKPSSASDHTTEHAFVEIQRFQHSRFFREKKNKKKTEA